MWFVSSHNATIRVLSGYGSVAAYVASSMSLQPKGMLMRHLFNVEARVC